MDIPIPPEAFTKDSSLSNLAATTATMRLPEVLLDGIFCIFSVLLLNMVKLNYFWNTYTFRHRNIVIIKTVRFLNL